MKRFSILLFVVISLFVFIKPASADDGFYTCTYRLPIGNQMINNFSIGITEYGDEYFDLVMTKNMYNIDYMKFETIPVSGYANHFTYIMNDLIYIDGYKYYYDSNSVKKGFNVEYFPIGLSGECPKIDSDFSYNILKKEVDWNFGDCLNGDITGMYFCTNDYTGVKGEVTGDVDQSVVSDIYKTCPLDLYDDGSGYRDNYYIKFDGKNYSYKFYDMDNVLPLISGNVECLPSSSFLVCYGETINGITDSQVIYSSDSCTRYLFGNLDYLDDDYYYEYSSDQSVSTGVEASCATTNMGRPDEVGSPAYYLQLVLNIMKYIAIVAVIGLGSVDFVQATAENDPDALKRASQKFSKRVIYTIILFVFPVVLEYLFILTGIYTDPFCGIG